jgi:hypothetical protein
MDLDKLESAVLIVLIVVVIILSSVATCSQM